MLHPISHEEREHVESMFLFLGGSKAKMLEYAIFQFVINHFTCKGSIFFKFGATEALRKLIKKQKTLYHYIYVLLFLSTFADNYANRQQTDKYHPGPDCGGIISRLRGQCDERNMMDKRKMTIRIGRNSLSFTMFDAANTEQPIAFEPYIVKGGISMAANLREAFKTADLMATDTRRVQVMLDTPSTLVPIEQFEEEDLEPLFNHVFPAGQEQRVVLFNVLPDLKSVCLFAINKDLRGVICDQFDDVQFIQAMTPVWRHLHQRSFTGHRNKLYGYFHNKRLDLFSFQQNRFKFCNSFDAEHAYDALYFLLYVWRQLRLEAEHDELHIVGDIPQKDWLMQELKRYLQKAYIINPEADLQQAPITKTEGMPYDLMTLLVKGR